MNSQGMVLRLPLLVSAALLIGGCQAVKTKQHTESFDQQLVGGRYADAAQTALKAGSITPQGDSDSLLWSLQAGTALSLKGDYVFSNTVLDKAESRMKLEDQENLAQDGAETVTAVLLNNSFNAYEPAVYDGVMANTYKALNYIMLNDWPNARIELNRAADRQRRAVEYFSEKIEEDKRKQVEAEQKLAEKRKPGEPGVDYVKSASASEKAVYEQFPELQEWQVYPDYVNPYTDYLHGLYFFLAATDKSDTGKARQSLRRVAGMVPDNAAVQADLQAVDNIRRGKWRKQQLEPTVWVLFENGLAPRVDETVIPLPLFLVSDKVSYAQLALPKLQSVDNSVPYLKLSSAGANLGNTQMLASIERVIQTEFKKEFPSRITTAIASTLTKAIIQSKVQKRGGLFGEIAGTLYQAATTHADTRSWSALPQEVQVARIGKPDNNELTLDVPGGAGPLTLTLPKTKFAIVHVRAIDQAPPVVNVTGFDS